MADNRNKPHESRNVIWYWFNFRDNPLSIWQELLLSKTNVLESVFRCFVRCPAAVLWHSKAVGKESQAGLSWNAYHNFVFFGYPWCLPVFHLFLLCRCQMLFVFGSFYRCSLSFLTSFHGCSVTFVLYLLQAQKDLQESNRSLRDQVPLPQSASFLPSFLLGRPRDSPVLLTWWAFSLIREDIFKKTHQQKWAYGSWCAEIQRIMHAKSKNKRVSGSPVLRHGSAPDVFQWSWHLLSFDQQLAQHRFEQSEIFAYLNKELVQKSKAVSQLEAKVHVRFCVQAMLHERDLHLRTLAYDARFSERMLETRAPELSCLTMIVMSHKWPFWKRMCIADLFLGCCVSCVMNLCAGAWERCQRTRGRLWSAIDDGEEFGKGHDSETGARGTDVLSASALVHPKPIPLLWTV